MMGFLGCSGSSKLVKRLQRYGDFTVFKVATVCRFGFLKFKFLMVMAVKRHIVHHRAKFHEYWSSWISKIQSVRGRGPCVHHSVRFHQNVSNSSVDMAI